MLVPEVLYIHTFSFNFKTNFQCLNFSTNNLIYFGYVLQIIIHYLIPLIFKFSSSKMSLPVAMKLFKILDLLSEREKKCLAMVNFRPQKINKDDNIIKCFQTDWYLLFYNWFSAIMKNHLCHRITFNFTLILK